VRILAERGDLEDAQAVVDSMHAAWEKSGDTPLEAVYRHAAGLLAYARGNIDESIAFLEKAAEFYEGFWYQYSLARACMESGRSEKTIQVLEKVIGRYGEHRLDNPIASVKAHYLLGLAYEQKGAQGKAIEQYERFLDIWKDADPDLDEVPDARRRLALLREKQI
jgi:tetratricopeptide (TPR) repeat protein